MNVEEKNSCPTTVLNVKRRRIKQNGLNPILRMLS